MPSSYCCFSCPNLKSYCRLRLFTVCSPRLSICLLRLFRLKQPVSSLRPTPAGTFPQNLIESRASSFWNSLLSHFRTLHCASSSTGHCRLQAQSWGFSSLLCALFLGCSHSPMAGNTIYNLCADDCQIEILVSRPQCSSSTVYSTFSWNLQFNMSKRELLIFLKLQTCFSSSFPHSVNSTSCSRQKVGSNSVFSLLQQPLQHQTHSFGYVSLAMTLLQPRITELVPYDLPSSTLPSSAQRLEQQSFRNMSDYIMLQQPSPAFRTKSKLSPKSMRLFVLQPHLYLRLYLLPLCSVYYVLSALVFSWYLTHIKPLSFSGMFLC